MKTHITLIAFCFTLALSACYKEKDYLPSNVDYSKFLLLSTSDSIIVADGESTSYITAEIPMEIRDDKASVVFTTNKGTFDNGTKTITKIATIQSINNVNKRIAKIKLTSSTKIEKATIEATVGDISQSLEVSFENINYDNLLLLSTVQSQISADGESSIDIIVDQPLDTKEEYTAISFSTTKGIFENNAKTISKSSVIVWDNGIYKRRAVVRLISSKKVENTDIEAGIKGYIKKTSVSFIKAFPESLKLSTTAISISPGYGNTLTITTTLSRQKGTPSIGNLATLMVSDSNRNSIGYFVNYNNVSDENGTISNKFTLGDLNYHGPLKIIAQSTDTNNQIIKDSIQIVSL
jgi:hypothetical protein